MNWFDKIITKVGLDKITHMFVIAFVTVALALIFNKTTQDCSSWVYAVCGLCGGIIVAILKEVLDFFYGKWFDLKDIIWGIAGGVIAFLCVGTFL